ncbi:RNA-binding S4 domain-containing protein [Colwellia sp. BRX10-3]|uniref:RNA-binding S4 domain-containing protein n=1 Tax=Colwellia sp. BRX10-3 TaxID=2759844 RepID=UPI0015F623DA|nr:RNA-binding S4 domain-containing protein [Colwellia sp. BRX10-3]MBA6391498.1 RNA-binding S4 domain-containing protein [Colwellia sp. BRX10-3]
MTNDIPLIDVSIQPIELCKLLKIANMVGGGGEAKIVICEGYVLLNNEVEFQKRKKVYHNDIVEFNGEIIQVNYKEPSNIELSEITKTKAKVVQNKSQKAKPAKPAKPAKKNKSSSHVKQPTPQTIDINRSKRKPISF